MADRHTNSLMGAVIYPMESKLTSLLRSNQQELDDCHTPPLAQYDFGSFTDRLRFLYNLLANPLESSTAQYQAYLDSGCRMFGAQHGFVSKVQESSRHRLLAVTRNSEQFSTDQELDLAGSFCDEIVQQEKTICAPKVGADRVQSPFVAYNGLGATSYIGTPIKVGQQLFGVLCFISTTPRQGEFSPNDIETIELMAEGVARMIEIQSAQAKERVNEAAGFAVAGVKSLDEYIQQARLPEVYGVPGRVVEVLQRRIGKAPLAIDYIAEELNLSKRTLQRRLQQQHISFAQLRDQVRFHFSIGYLIEQNLSIDSISASLDFSDRTSFTNAFKRWTNLSPSTFRKLFRDYA
ncbi:helix-turn-helix domain-containing protein [Exilibacterium tricleocarpae]|uniref:Helix-turn-helix domain-containing protein n=1 Tax=Exilibacterium tricleocarpae TaxID=2591008 RepID=A0A545T8J2_9GAMM|nr:helix-turn-helix domain-containing protein [Exilibacterium tricleocarpae]TQV73508.1 helix-turn-helix domain-containing protein [Exilibacterium tricleocarpae]